RASVRCCHGLIGHPVDVVLRLLRDERHARGLRMRAQPPGLLLLRAIHIAHALRPDAPRRTELRDLLEEVVVHVEEERQAGSEIIDVEAAGDAALYILEA